MFSCCPKRGSFKAAPLFINKIKKERKKLNSLEASARKMGNRRKDLLKHANINVNTVDKATQS